MCEMGASCDFQNYFGESINKRFWRLLLYFTKVNFLWVKLSEISYNNIKYNDTKNSKLSEVYKNGGIVLIRIIRFFWVLEGAQNYLGLTMDCVWGSPLVFDSSS